MVNLAEIGAFHSATEVIPYSSAGTLDVWSLNLNTRFYCDNLEVLFVRQHDIPRL